jgi:hypothetical protein
MVGGWVQAAQLPIIDALALVDQHMRQEARQAFRHLQLCYFGSLPLYAMGGQPPDPPEMDEDED